MPVMGMRSFRARRRLLFAVVTLIALVVLIKQLNTETFDSTISHFFHSIPDEVVDDKFLVPEKYKPLFKRLNTPLVTNADKFTPGQAEMMGVRRLQKYQELIEYALDKPLVGNLVTQDDERAGKASATIVSVVRNKELNPLINAMLEMEAAFNHKFNYTYTILSDEDFSDIFKADIEEYIPGRDVFYGKIDYNDWAMPEEIDRNLFMKNAQIQSDNGVPFAKDINRHNMHRYFAKGFYNHPLLKNVKYAWRLEPNSALYCDIDYDIFQFMQMNNKIYGYVINTFEAPYAVRTLWPKTMSFMKSHPHFLNPNGAFEWLKENGQHPENYAIAQGYSTCHFWTNFEIVDMDFLRSEPHQAYMDYLDEQGGFYYENWRDGPVRSVALGLLADKSQIHWFRDLGYHHSPFTYCPRSPFGNERCHGRCGPAALHVGSKADMQNCQGVWINNVMTPEDRRLYEEDPSDAQTGDNSNSPQ